eukprot:COSAG02_NODE_8891_length_2406_cov_2.353273_3_plen_102_part_00
MEDRRAFGHMSWLDRIEEEDVRALLWKKSSHGSQLYALIQYRRVHRAESSISMHADLLMSPKRARPCQKSVMEGVQRQQLHDFLLLCRRHASRRAQKRQYS